LRRRDLASHLDATQLRELHQVGNPHDPLLHPSRQRRGLGSLPRNELTAVLPHPEARGPEPALLAIGFQKRDANLRPGGKLDPVALREPPETAQLLRSSAPGRAVGHLAGDKIHEPDARALRECGAALHRDRKRE
jgi:hypothetical protein